MNLKDEVVNKLYEILKENFSIEEILIEKPKDRKMADYAVPCFVYAKKLHKSPNDIALYLKENLKEYECKVNGGYLNIFLKKKEIAKNILTEVLIKQGNYGANNLGKGKNIVIEYSSPNIAKPFGVGHLRSTVIGEAIKNICMKSGYNVYSINYLGDYGTQFGKLIYAYKNWSNPDDFTKNPIDELKRIYVKFHKEAETNPALNEEGRKWFKRLEDGDEEAVRLWEWFKDESLKDFQKTYNLLKINKFDSYNGEAYYKDKMEKVVDELETKKLLEKDDGALIVRLGEDMIPALIKRTDGGTLYITRDLAAAIDRKNVYNFDESLYVVGNEQALHFKQLKMILELLGYDWSKNIHHIAFGMVLQNGKKMSTRQGKTFKLQDLLDESISLSKKYLMEKNSNIDNIDIASEKIGVGAVIFNDLKNYRINDIEFNLEDILRFEGNTGPYIQYTYARIKSLLKHINNTEVNYNELDINEYTWNIIVDIYEFSDIIYRAKKSYDPSLIAKYLIDLAQDFNKFYANEKIIDEDANILSFNLKICESVSVVLKEGMRLLGIEVLEQM